MDNKSLRFNPWTHRFACSHCRLVLMLLCLLGAQIGAYADDSLHLTLTSSEEGELKSLLGDKKLLVDELTIKGVIGDEDFDTLWEASCYGRLKVLNLLEAQAEIPEYAFYNKDVQGDPKDGDFRPIKLKNVLLPKNIWEIGQYAFYGVPLETVNWDDMSLAYIHDYAFAYTSLKGVNLYHIEYVEDHAFAYSSIECVDIVYASLIGDSSFEGCKNLKNMTVPSSVNFGSRAFYGCDLHDIKFKEDDGLYYFQLQCFGANRNLRNLFFKTQTKGFTIGTDAFEDCELETITFASPIKLYDGSFRNFPTLKRIYCSTEEPPVTTEVDIMGRVKHYYPFGGGTSKDIPVYVPYGCVEVYRNTPGWDYFHNFIETDDFPTSSVDPVISDAAGDITTTKGGIIIRSDKDCNYGVYTLDGLAAESGVNEANCAIKLSLNAGIYIVHVGSKVQKIIVK